MAIPHIENLFTLFPSYAVLAKGCLFVRSAVVGSRDGAGGGVPPAAT